MSIWLSIVQGLGPWWDEQKFRFRRVSLTFQCLVARMCISASLFNIVIYMVYIEELAEMLRKKRSILTPELLMSKVATTNAWQSEDGAPTSVRHVCGVRAHTC